MAGTDHMHAPQLLKQLHAAVRQQLVGELQSATEARRRRDLMDTTAEELEVHAQIEEIFYPAVRPVSALVAHAREEHTQVRRLIGDIEGRDPASPEFAQKVSLLRQPVSDHVAEEEGQMFVEARGEQLHEREQTLKTSIVQRGIRGLKLAAKKVA